LRRASPRLQARARRHRIEAPWLALPLWPLAALGQEQEPGGTRSEAGGGGGLGQREMATTQGKMPFVFGMVILATLLIAARDRPC